MSRSSPRHEIRGGRSYHNKAGGASKLDVVQGVTGRYKVCVDPSTSKRFKSYRPNKLLRRTCQYYIHFGAGLREQARYECCLVAGYTPGNSQEYTPAGKGAKSVTQGAGE